jgi:hypothetical protein
MLSAIAWGWSSVTAVSNESSQLPSRHQYRDYLWGGAPFEVCQQVKGFCFKGVSMLSLPLNIP